MFIYLFFSIKDNSKKMYELFSAKLDKKTFSGVSAYCNIYGLLTVYLLCALLQRFTVSVYRRYTDFDVFHELLLQRYAYRVVPALPPKRALKGGEVLIHYSL